MKKISLVILVSVFLFSCKFDKKDDQNPTPGDDEKALTITEFNNQVATRDFATSKKVTVEGYYWNETTPMLVSDMKLLNINTPIPDDKYILLNGKGVDALKGKDNYQGAKVRITIPMDSKMGSRGLGQPFVITDLPLIIAKPTSGIYIPTPIDWCQRYPHLCKIDVLKFSKNYAILYSGGVNAGNAHLRYWNDLKFMYTTLKNKYGYTDDRIIVIYKDGVAQDAGMTVDYAASVTGVRTAFTTLKGKITTLDNLFFFATNHGGGYHRGNNTQGEATPHLAGGVNDVAVFDEIDVRKVDETIYYYGQANNTIIDDSLSKWISSLKFKTFTALLEPCFSGGLLYDLRGTNRVIMSAADEFQYSYGGLTNGGVSFDIFSYYFTEAINKMSFSGAALSTNPDTNGDGKVSALEAFKYAKSKDNAEESPQLEDSGDGISTNNPSAAAGDGVKANTRMF
jgi:hypothetical protein